MRTAPLPGRCQGRQRAVHTTERCVSSAVLTRPGSDPAGVDGRVGSRTLRARLCSGRRLCAARRLPAPARQSAHRAVEPPPPPPPSVRPPRCGAALARRPDRDSHREPVNGRACRHKAGTAGHRSASISADGICRSHHGRDSISSNETGRTGRVPPDTTESHRRDRRRTHRTKTPTTGLARKSESDAFVIHNAVPWPATLTVDLLSAAASRKLVCLWLH